MKLRLILFLFLLPCCFTVFAQQDRELFGTLGKDEKKIHQGFAFAVNGNFDIPGADMAKRFGLSYRIGPSVTYKTKNNWLIGAKFDFILGNKIKEDSLMINIAPFGSFIDNDGSRKTIDIYERGYAVGFQVGKIISFSPATTENGLLIMTGAGFIQHKIKIYDKSAKVPSVQGDLVKGYDRLTNGLYIEQFAGYNYFAVNGLINFYLGVNVMAGFTQGRRDYLFDVQRPDNGNRLDLLFGIKGGWYIPVFKRKSEDYYYQ